jgi:hypothetical protein
MAGGFDTRGVGEAGPNDPGRAAREAADRIAQQVRDILQAAEQRAVEIRSRAELDASEIRENAAGAAARMLERVDELETTMDASLRTFFESIRSELEALAPLEQIEAAAEAQRADIGEPEAGPSVVDEPEIDRAEEAAVEPEEQERPFEEPEEAEEPRRRRGRLWGRREKEPEPSETAEPDEPTAEGAEDAHVMALNMALNGTPRDETETYLVQRFGHFGELESILDDVYGRVKRE